MTGRKSGVLLHISSLMGEYGIGTFGKEAKRFIDFLEQAGFHYWQVLPFTRMTPAILLIKATGAFAGNLLFLDPGGLRDRAPADGGRMSGMPVSHALCRGVRLAAGKQTASFPQGLFPDGRGAAPEGGGFSG